MPASDDIHVRIPRKLKRAAQKVIEANGLDVSSAIRLFFTHISLRKTIPLKFVTTESGLPKEFEQSLLKQIAHPDIVATLDTPEDIEKFFNGL